MTFTERWRERLIEKIIDQQKRSNAVHALSQMGIYINQEAGQVGTISYTPEGQKTLNTYLNRRAAVHQQEAFDKLFDQVNKLTIQSAKNELADGVMAYYRKNWKEHLLALIVSTILTFSTIYIILFLFALAINDQHLIHFLTLR